MKEVINSIPEKVRLKYSFFLNERYMNHFVEPSYMGFKIYFIPNMIESTIIATDPHNIWMGA